MPPCTRGDPAARVPSLIMDETTDGGDEGKTIDGETTDIYPSPAYYLSTHHNLVSTLREAEATLRMRIPECRATAMGVVEKNFARLRARFILEPLLLNF